MSNQQESEPKDYF